VNRVASSLVLSMVAACARPVPSQAPVAQAAARDGGKARDERVGAPREAPRRAVLRLTSDRDTDALVLGELSFEGSLARVSSLRFQPSHDARIEAIVVRDARGEIDLRRRDEGTIVRVELGRATTGTLDVRYTVKLGGPTDAYSPVAEPVEFRGGGDDLLLLPEVDLRENDEPFPIELRLRTGGASIEAASSFGLGIEQQATCRVSELRRAFFLAGDVGTAAFRTSYARDVAGWLGPTAFDPRWVSAETAGVRSAVDAYVGWSSSPDASPVSLLLVAVRQSDPSIVVTPRARGLVVGVDRRAAWTPTARLLVAQVLTQRYIGGFLWVGDRKEASSGYFFSDGFSRAIAREVLFEGSLFDHADRVAELNTLLAATVLSEDPRELATARGALIATALDVALRKKSDGSSTLRTFIRDRLTYATEAKRDTITLDEFMTEIRTSAGEAKAREIDASLIRGAAIELPSDYAGPCYTLKREPLVPFELGFVSSSADEMTVLSVKRGSRAEAAGVRVGDVIGELHYEAGRSRIPVRLVVVRGAKRIPLRFFPAGPSKAGRAFERVSGIPNERC
jgi:hypothetical protein